jgi:hypothetical protein
LKVAAAAANGEPTGDDGINLTRHAMDLPSSRLGPCGTGSADVEVVLERATEQRLVDTA